MSMPNIPDIKPDIDIDIEKAVDLLVASIALEELGLAHIINAEAEKIQFVLGTLKKDEHGENDDRKNGEQEEPTVDDLLNIDKAVERMLRKVIDEEILLQFKLEDAVELKKEKDEHKENDKGDD